MPDDARCECGHRKEDHVLVKQGKNWNPKYCDMALCCCLEYKPESANLYSAEPVTGRPA